MGIQLLYTPSCSLDLNPIELCFNEVKTELNGELRELVYSNMNLAIIEAVDTIKARDMAGFYEATAYIVHVCMRTVTLNLCCFFF